MKKVLLFIGMFLSIMSVNAEDNVLQSIEIVPVKDTYNIVLTADKSVDVKKTVQAPNKITLEMKGIRASKTLNTVYNNVSNVDTVMVEPSGNGISLFFQAENASEASVSFDSIAVPVAAAAKPAKQLKLNSPIDSYAPIYREEVTGGKTSPLFNKLTEKSSAIKNELMEGSNAEDTAYSLNKMISYGLIGLLAFSVIRLFRRSKESDNMKIGLSQGLKEREIEMYRSSQPFGTSYTNLDKPFTTVNYGINAYKKESQNPYEQEMPIHNPRLRNYPNTGLNSSVSSMSGNYGSVSTQAPKQTAVSVQQPVKKSVTPSVDTGLQTNPNVDNLKFLESMTAIYEKSGRHDLAQGLKASLSKNVKY